MFLWSSGWWILVTVALAVLAAIAGCRSPLVGESGFEIMPPPRSLLGAPPQREAEPVSELYVVYIPIRPRGELVQPDYPAVALTAEPTDYVVYITLTVGEDGRVRDVMPSLTRPMLPHPFADAFLEAVYVAVARWELEPARQVYWQRVVGGEDQYLRTETVAERIELKFHFTASRQVR